MQSIPFGWQDEAERKLSPDPKQMSATSSWKSANPLLESESHGASWTHQNTCYGWGYTGNEGDERWGLWERKWIGIPGLLLLLKEQQTLRPSLEKFHQAMSSIRWSPWSSTLWRMVARYRPCRDRLFLTAPQAILAGTEWHVFKPFSNNEFTILFRHVFLIFNSWE